MSETEKVTHIISILKELLRGEVSTSIDAKASNRNQYYPIIKKHGIELIEVWKPNLLNSGRHKERRLHATAENIKAAQEYLNKLLGKNENAVGFNS